MKYFVNSLLFFVLIHLSSFVFAQSLKFANSQDILQSQMKYLELPEYCQTRLLERDMTNRSLVLPPPHSLLVKKWSNIIGRRNWIYFHHYCWGIRNTKAALSEFGVGKDSDKNYKYWLKRASGEFRFMKDRADKTFPFWGQLKTYDDFISSSLNGK